ncbi:N-acetyltransferase [Sediminibacillus albus]|uniref:Transferase hexapeptide (Six repeat-containing protein) n=1 Tax=Sediminibacillus albus TaxID=407036 RepID=A0A1G9CDI5_9BACI|nr:N-acetyltransferase [Sediminibacillus albus]SDK49485.1 transferase hexapeptide (six repeat-containing protein) [Sediminibacillus albus]
MIHSSAFIGENVSLGENVVIEPDVIIGNNTTIGNFVVIKQGTIIGSNVYVGDLTSLGKTPSSNKKMARHPAKDIPPLLIDDQVTIGNHCVIYKGSVIHKGILIGDLASIREGVEIREDSIIGRNAMVENNTYIGKRVTIQTSSYITADMTIEDEVFIGPCCSSSNDKYMGMGNYEHKGPTLKKGAKVGNNATLLPSVTIGERVIVGAGAVVTKNITDDDVVAGSPAKPLNKRKIV